MSLSGHRSASPGQNAPRGGSSSKGPWVRGLMQAAGWGEQMREMPFATPILEGALE